MKIAWYYVEANNNYVIINFMFNRGSLSKVICIFI